MSADAETRRARGLYIAFPEGTRFPRESTGVYADAVLSEAETRRAGLGRGPVVAWMAGGEPWRFEIGELERLFHGLARILPPAPRAERSIEWTVPDCSPERLASLRRFGFNRICLTGRTRAAGYRPATESGAARAVREARKAGFRRIGFDIDPFSGEAGLLRPEEAASAGADHVSLTEDPKGGVSEDCWIDRYLAARRSLEEAGLLRYETTLFARPGSRSVGLLLIAAGGNWTGVGAGAVSTDPGERRRNEPDPERYVRILRSVGDPAVFREGRGGEDIFRDRVFHGLRRIRGLHMGALTARFGREKVRALEERSLLLRRAGILRKEGERLIPTDRGFLTAEGAARELLHRGVDQKKEPFS